MRIWLVLALAALAALAAPRGAAAAAEPQRWAVVIGVDRYQNPGVADLEYAEADARLFAEALRSSAGFPEENVFLLTTAAGGDQAPLRTNVAFRFDWLRRQVGPEDTLVVYFSGHGVEIEGQSFLLTAEADARSLLTLQQSALHARDLFAWFAATGAGQTLLVVDACRNDPIQGRGTGDNVLGEALARDLSTVDLPATSRQPSSATLFACSAGQRSYEWADRGHGFFTWFLVEGLKGQAAGADGAVTLASLSRYLQVQVPQASHRWAMKEQSPWLRYEGPGTDLWVLSRPGPPVAGDGALAAAERRAREAEEARRAAEERARRAEEAPARPAEESATRDLLGRLASLESSLYGGAAPTRLVWVAQSPGAPYRSVARAVAEAPAGARIVIRPGVYEEQVVVSKSVELVGDGEPGAVVLRSPGGPVVKVTGSASAVLENLTLEGAVEGNATLHGCRQP